MIKKIVLSFIAILVLIVAAGAVYLYYFPAPQDTPTQVVNNLPVQPNNSIAAGPVTAISATTISLKKQDGTTVVFNIGSSTSILLGQDGQAAAPQKAGDIKAGMVVLVTPSNSDAKVAQSIIIVPPPVQ